MILEIRLSNFFSIKEEIVLDLRAANIKSKNAKAFRLKAKDLNLANGKLKFE